MKSRAANKQPLTQQEQKTMKHIQLKRIFLQLNAKQVYGKVLYLFEDEYTIRIQRIQYILMINPLLTVILLRIS